MPDLLLELFCEEIPARFQGKAADDLQKLITNDLVDAGLTYEGARAYVTPRRLTLDIRGLLARSADVSETRKGPKVGAPEQALAGFMRGAGLASIDDAEIIDDPKKGQIYAVTVHKSGRAAAEIISETVPQVVQRFPWAKSMRWGAASAQPGALTWVRPLRSILCTFGPETEEPDILPIDIPGVESAGVTFGHRFHAPDAIRVKRFDDYQRSLEQAKVIIDAERRQEIIVKDAESICFAQGLSLVEDPRLAREVAGLVEWPVVLMGQFESAFLDIPEEVIQTTIRENQKCFVVRDAAGGLANKFIMVANLEATDGGATIIAGNEKVIRARLADAKFFWDQDLKLRLEDRLPQLETVTFHEKLGSQGDRVARIITLTGQIADKVGADVANCERAAMLAKADLVSGMVFEFAELQGLMGRYYATHQGEPAAIAEAVEHHYRPQGPSDAIPAHLTAQTVGLADKLDMLIGFWSIDEKPTGSRDPFALRRAALGVIRICIEADLVLPLREVGVSDDLLGFFHDRLKVYLRDQGIRHDVIDAILTDDADDMRACASRSTALAGFLESEDGQNLLAGYRRAANILAAEEKSGDRFAGQFDPAGLMMPAERALAEAIAVSGPNPTEDYAGALNALAALCGPVDAFFDVVLVNDPDPAVRSNRLNLLATLRQNMEYVADFSKIAG